MLAKADGQLRHCYFGEYSAVIALGFNDEYEANESIRKLGPGWKHGQKSNVLVWVGNTTELEGCKHVLVSFGADEKKIDSCAHSIDYGEPFSIHIEIVSKEQMKLF